MFDLHFIILNLIVLCGNIVEAVTGFGSTIIAVTLGAHMYRIDYLVTTLVPLNIIISIYIVVRHRDAMDLKELFGKFVPFLGLRKIAGEPDGGSSYPDGILPMAGLGLAVGIFVFNTVDIDILKKIYGVFVFAFSLFEVVRISRSKDVVQVPLGRAQSAFWLVFGGIMQGIYASGGPMVVYYASRKLPNKAFFRCTLSGLWLILNLAMFISHLISGKTDIETLRTSVMLLPALIGGIVIGEWIHTRMPERIFRLVVFIILIIAGASLVIG